MLKSKAILVRGETKYYNGKVLRDLDVNVEKAIDEFVSTIDQKSIVDVKVNTEFSGNSGDQAFILILYNTVEQEVEVKAVKNKK